MDETPKKRNSVSSGFVRHVGDVRIEVVNTKQRADEVTKAAMDYKWAVMVYNGKKKSLVKGFARKYDAIAALQAHEHKLRSA
tara:strand:+ start:350 stop:595 length:246 start_codon:yes stop_codon:yes gene_type:complete